MSRRGHTWGHWSKVLATLGDKEKNEFHDQFDRCRNDFLDTCQGRCLLKRPDLANIVASSLLHFDGDRYQMGDFVVMPNHVHLLCAFQNPQQMHNQFDSWLHFTAVKINQRTGGRGHFWQQEPNKAKLKRGEYLYRRLDG